MSGHVRAIERLLYLAAASVLATMACENALQTGFGSIVIQAAPIGTDEGAPTASVGVELSASGEMPAPAEVMVQDSAKVTVTGPTTKTVTLTLSGATFTGTVDQLPVGSYTVNIYWYKAQEVSYHNRVTGITVTAGGSTPANISSPTSFVPTLTAIGSPTWLFRVSGTFSAVANADSYKVEYANNPTFTSPTTVTPWPKVATAPALLTFNSTGTWYWRVRAANAQAPAGGQASTTGTVGVSTDVRPSADDPTTAPNLGFFANTSQTLDSLNISPATDADWFSLSQCNGDSLTVNVLAARLSPASPLNSYVQVYNNAGLLIAQNDDSAAANTDAFVKAGHTYDNAYKVRVSGSQSTVGHYKLQVQGRAGGNNLTGSCRVTPLSILQVSAGLYHTCAIRNPSGVNVVDCWGINYNGQLGNGTTANFTSSAVRVSGSTVFNSISAGSFHTCGLTAAGAAYCWGSNNVGQLGDGSALDRSVPTAVTGGYQFSTLSAGHNHTCGITTAGQAYCWGSNASGQFGNGGTSSSQAPTLVPLPSGVATFTALSTGQTHTCLVGNNGTLYCAGDNTSGQLGQGTTSTSPTLSLVSVTAPGGVWVQVGLGTQHTCARANTNLIYCWGDNRFGQLGDGTFTSRSTVGGTVGSLLFASLDAGRNFNCGLVGNQNYCWGSNFNGQVGTGTTFDQANPVLVTGGINFTSVSAGSFHACGVSSASGTTYCWGWAGFGQVGDGAPFNQVGPTPISGGLSWKFLSIGNEHTCGITNANTTYCWGWNQSGQLGDGTATTRLVPTAVSTGVTFSSVGTGVNHSCGLAAGTAYCWGDNTEGELGDGSGSPHATPAPVNPSPVFTQISVGDFHACGRTAANQVYCWGDGRYGNLANGGTGPNLSPILITGSVSFASVTAGGKTTCGLTAAGQAYCWGDNTYGEIGNGGTSGSPVLGPTLVTGGQTFASINPGFEFTCGRTTANAAYCWGSNSSGQLGTGNNTNVSSPTLVTGGITWSGISTSRNANACGFNASGFGYCWGNNFYGQLGEGTFANKTAPTPVFTGLSFSVTPPGLQAGDYHTCGFTTAGAGFCWGNNENGQLGNGSRTIRTAPTAVVTGPASAPPVMIDPSMAREFGPEAPIRRDKSSRGAAHVKSFDRTSR